MDIPDIPNFEEFTAAPGQSAFAFDFLIFAATDLNVYVDGELATFASPATGVDQYDVAFTDGVLGGTVNFGGGMVGGERVRLDRNVPVERTGEFSTTGPLNIGALNKLLDRGIVYAQDAKAAVAGAFRAPAGEQVNPLPLAMDRAGKVAFFDALGNMVARGVADDVLALRATNGAGFVGFDPELSYEAQSVGAKLRTTLAANDFVGPDDTAIIAAAVAEAQERGVHTTVLLDRDYTVTGLFNPYGVRFTGPGRIVKAITGGFQQLNSYADAPGRIVYGKEYLFRVFQRAALGQSGGSGKIGCFLFGDSTVANGYMTVTTQALLQSLFEVRGVGNIAITNRGVAGTMVSDMNALPDLATTTDLLVIKYGINDGGNPDASRLATFQSTFDAKLSAIRGAINGGVGSLSIVLVGPNATGDTPNGRDERWYEQLRGVYVELARKHKCCFIDTYAAFRDPRGGASLWLDDPYGDGRGIHPKDSLGFQIWSLVADTIISRDEAVNFGTSNFRNLTSGVYAPTNAAQPSQWPMGLVVARATTGNGFPLDGFIVSIRNPDQGVLQRLFPFNPNNSRTLMRTANVAGGTFNRWTGAPENLTFANGWAAFGGFAAPSAVMLESGMVALRGMIQGGTVTAGTKVATLPAGMAPLANEIFECAGNGGRVMVKVQSNGDVVLQSAGDATYTSLSGIHFLAA